MSNNEEHKDLPLVPETILKRRHNLDELRARREAKGPIKPRYVRRKDTGPQIIKPESLLAHAKSRHNMMKRYRRVRTKGMQKRASKDKVIEIKKGTDDTTLVKEGNNNKTKKEIEFKYSANSVGSKFVFCFRIRDNTGIPNIMKKILHKFNLHKKYEGVFIELTPENQKNLHLVEPCVIYGVPSKATVMELIKRRGHGKINNERVPLSNNVIIEETLGPDYGLLCLEDLAHEIYSGGDNFKVVSNFFYPFQLTAPHSKMEKRVFKMKETKDYGDKGALIEDMIKLIL